MIVFLVILAILLWGIFRLKRRRLYELADSFASSDAELPIIGVTHTLFGSSKKILTTLQSFSYQAMKTNGKVKGWSNNRLYLLMLNPEDIEVISRNCLEKEEVVHVLRDIVGNGTIFAPVSVWRPRRKILVATFKPKILEQFIEVFANQSETLVKQLTNYTECGAFDVWPFISAYALDAVCETAMGSKIDAQKNPNSNFLTSMNRVLYISSQRIFRLWLQPLWLFKLFPCYVEYSKSLSKLYELTDEVILKKREEQKAAKNTLTKDIHNYTQSFLELLIERTGGDKGYTEVELREEILTLIIAGTDTSATALGYLLVLLSKYPKIQEKMYTEIRNVFQESDRPVVKDDLQNLKYLEIVIKESLRLFPPVPFIIRQNETEINLPSGHILPAGCGVILSIWGVHRDPKYWGPDAEHFNPDRFLKEGFKLKHPCTYMPFSSGPRNCVGYQYAMMSIKIAAATILRKYRIVGQEESSPIPHIPCTFEIMMKPVNGYRIQLQKRNQE